MNRYAPALLFLVGLGIVLMQNFTLPDWGSVLPIPSPTVDSAWFVLVEESSERTPELTAMVTSKQWADFRDKSIQTRIYDADSEDAAKYVEAAKGKIPSLLVLDAKDGRVIKVVDPSQGVDLDALAKEVTGR